MMTTFFTRLALVASLIALLLALAARGIGTFFTHSQWIPLIFRIDQSPAQLYVFDTRTHLLAHLSEQQDIAASPAFSPDAHSIAYLYFNGSDGVSSYGLKLDTVPSSRPAQLADNATISSPTWSPDGTQIAYEGGTINDDIYIIRLSDHSTRRMTENPFGDGQPTWSPDGNWLAYVTGSSTTPSDLYIVDAHCPEHCDSTALRLTNGDFNYAPVWSPDGSRIAYVSEGNGKHSINLLDTTCVVQRTSCGEEPPVLVIQGDFTVRGLVWSTDSQQIFLIGAVSRLPPLYPPLNAVGIYAISASCRNEPTCQPVPLVALDPPLGLKW